jgi:hypothetical protein
MGKMLKEFKATVPQETLEKAESLIVVTPNPSDEEVAATKAMLDAVLYGFYFEHVPKTDASAWNEIAAVNSAMEQGLRQYPKCLILVKHYIRKEIGEKILVGMENDPDYNIAKRLLYVTEEGTT